MKMRMTEDENGNENISTTLELCSSWTCEEALSREEEPQT